MNIRPGDVFGLILHIGASDEVAQLAPPVCLMRIVLLW